MYILKYKKMNHLSEQELPHIFGGQSMGKCDYLQDKAAEHMAEPCDDEEEEDAWWVMWAIEYQKCANG